MSNTPSSLTPREHALMQQVSLLLAQVTDLKAQVAQLTDKIARLERNSSNSNKRIRPMKPCGF